MKILKFIRDYGGRVRMRDLIKNLDKLNMSKQTLITKLKELERTGIIIHKYDLSSRPPSSWYLTVEKEIEKESGILTKRHANEILKIFELEKKIIKAKGEEKIELFRKILNIGLYDICFNIIAYVYSITIIEDTLKKYPDLINKIEKIIYNPHLSFIMDVVESWLSKFLEIAWKNRYDLARFLEEMPSIEVLVDFSKRKHQ